MNFSDFFMEMLRNKKAVIEELFKDLLQSQKIDEGTNRFISRIDMTSDLDLRKQVKTLTKIINRQNSTLQRLITICLIYSQSNNYNSDVAIALTKLGSGQEAVQELFKQKMGN